MKKKSLLGLVVRGFLLVCLIDLVLIGVVVGISWWTGWTDIDSFQTAIQIAGVLVIGLGLVGIKGNREESQDQKGISGSNQDNREWKQGRLIELAQSFSFMLVMFSAGIVCLVIGWLM